MGAVPQRRGLQSADSIRRVALQLFYERGYDGTSMKEIADAANIHKSTVYHHVPSKGELLRAICEATLGALDASLGSAEANAGTPGEQLHLALTGAVRTALGDPYATSVIIRLRPNSVTARAVIKRRRIYEDRFSRLVQAAQKSGEIRSDVDPLLLARLALGTINTVVDWFDPGGKYSIAVVEGAVVAMASHGWSGADVA